MPQNKEYPIIFSTKMTEAILKGEKTQTRRIIKQQPIIDVDKLPGNLTGVIYKNEYYVIQNLIDRPDLSLSIECPYGQPGDLLWVREPFMYSYFYPDNGQVIVKYKTGEQRLIENYPYWILVKNFNKWKPSIHMPKAAARLWLEITNIEVQRLQDINENQAIAEGVGAGFQMNSGWPDYLNIKNGICSLTQDSARMSFSSLWDSIHGPSSWNQNPWVWVVHFKISKLIKNPQIYGS